MARKTKFVPPQQCGQGPYRFEVEALGADVYESIHLAICTHTSFKGSVSFESPALEKTEKTFGDDTDLHKRCLADSKVVATRGGEANGPAGTSGSHGKAEPVESMKPVATVVRGEAVAKDIDCPGKLGITIGGVGWSFDQERKRKTFVVEIWTPLPVDWTNMMVLVEQRALPEHASREDLLAYWKAWGAWHAQHDEKLAQARAAGFAWKSVPVEAPTKQPPPPRAETPPPRPSPNATWIPGYWQFADGWVWSAGFWRVPQQDIEEERTVEAPAAPPAPKPEVAPDVAYHTARKAVWTPGHWMWNGAVYVWIPGSWRIPDDVQMRWVPPTWRPTRRGTLIFVPGGFVRIGPRR